MHTVLKDPPIKIASQAASSAAGVLIFPSFATLTTTISPLVMKARLALAEREEHDLEDVLAELGL